MRKEKVLVSSNACCSRTDDGSSDSHGAEMTAGIFAPRVAAASKSIQTEKGLLTTEWIDTHSAHRPEACGEFVADVRFAPTSRDLLVLGEEPGRGWLLSLSYT